MTSSSNNVDSSRAEVFLSLARLISLAALMETSLGHLEHKRVTLEEKMIKAYLNDLIATTGDYVHRVHSIVNQGTFDIEAKALSDLAGLVSDMQPVFEELQKTIEYDWNFLEQYYEHDFYGRLANEHRFKERLRQLPLCVVATKPV